MFHKLITHKYGSAIITLLLMLLSTLLSFCLFGIVKNSSANIALIYFLALILTARYTDGYCYGILFSLFSVICINFLFTYPYYHLNFTISGYPITFIILSTIALTTSATTSHMKIQAQLLAEREEILNKAEKEKMRANLLRAISHDLRTPLTSIIAESAAYFEDANTNGFDKKAFLVHRINEDANWLLHMVENLLSVTRIQDNQDTKVNKSVEIVEEIVSEAVVRFKKRQPNALVDASIPENYIMLPMDPLLIEQVIINLLDNAYIHSESSQEIQLTIKDDSNTSVSFHIRDFGKGIDPNIILDIFDGTIVHNVASPDAHRGMGIGLSICKTIIEAHAGTICAINHENGAEFIFTLPKEDTSCQQNTQS